MLENSSMPVPSVEGAQPEVLVSREWAFLALFRRLSEESQSDILRFMEALAQVFD
jgi:hypothetical protein